jgi:hypothetical protein
MTPERAGDGRMPTPNRTRAIVPAPRQTAKSPAATPFPLATARAKRANM